MKKIKRLFISSLLLLSLTGCGVDAVDSSNANAPQYEGIQDIYKLYVSQGGSLSYEDWLDSLKGEDGQDGLTPFIGTNGNWWIGNKDTGVKAAGEDGKNGKDGQNGADGLTPTIGKNGNWWVGDKDTGIKATGENGKSAYEIYCENHTEYTGTEQEWLIDIANGSLTSPLEYEVKLYNGDDLFATENVERGALAERPDNNPTKSGYVFDGWFDSDDKQWLFDQYPVYGNINLHSQFSVAHYSIVYQLHGGTNSVENPTDYYGTEQQYVFKNPSRDGYIFKGWYFGQDRVFAINADNAEDMVLEARWEEDDYTHITTPAELHDALTGDPTGKYILDNDIDMTGVDMSTPSNFSGVFDGNFHIIRNTTGRLFQDSTGIVRNCKIVNTSPLTATPTAFVSMNYGSIYNCAYEGDFDLSGEYIYLRVGAMTSINVGEIINCSFKGNIHAVNTHSGGYPTDAGGICGQNSDYARSNAAVIKYCYSIGNIYAEGNGCSGDAGGITGINYYDYLELSHCYFSGSVEGKMLQDLNNYKAGAGYISGGYFDGVNCYAFNGSTRTVTNGSLKGNEPLMDDYHEMVRLALEDSENYKFSMRDSTGNVVLPFGIAL